MIEWFAELKPEALDCGVAVDADALAQRLVLSLADAAPIAPSADVDPAESDIFAAMIAELEVTGGYRRAHRQQG